MTSLVRVQFKLKLWQFYNFSIVKLILYYEHLNCSFCRRRETSTIFSIKNPGTGSASQSHGNSTRNSSRNCLIPYRYFFLQPVRLRDVFFSLLPRPLMACPKVLLGRYLSEGRAEGGAGRRVPSFIKEHTHRLALDMLLMLSIYLQ